MNYLWKSSYFIGKTIIVLKIWTIYLFKILKKYFQELLTKNENTNYNIFNILPMFVD